MKDFLPVLPRAVGPMGLYLHVPFCRSRCSYCAFATNPYDAEEAEQYLHLLAAEMELWSNSGLREHAIEELSFDTIYIGGGSPSLLQPEQIAALLRACRSSFRIVEPAEVTIEINPATAALSDLIGFRTAGVNRASLGIQSFEDRELRLMGRAHTVRDGLIAFEDLRMAGFDNVSMDLIAGFPGQSIASLRATLNQVIALKPDHVSIYLLELKEGTRLAEQVAQGKLHPADDDLAARMYGLICGILTAAGYEHYEISNFAIPGRQSRHNLKYWTDCMYLGIGAGAHGMTGRRRYANMENPSLYRRALERGDFPSADVMAMTPEIRFKDALIMGLRLVKGVNLADLGRAYAVDARDFIEDTVGDLLDAGLLALDGDRVFLTSRGRLLSNVVFSRWV